MVLILTFPDTDDRWSRTGSFSEGGVFWSGSWQVLSEPVSCLSGETWAVHVNSYPELSLDPFVNVCVAVIGTFTSMTHQSRVSAVASEKRTQGKGYVVSPHQENWEGLRLLSLGPAVLLLKSCAPARHLCFTLQC